jgi:micrococcal nuclease
VVQEPVYEEPVYEEPAAPVETGGCDPNYTPCVPLVSYDLNCPDIGFTVQVVGADIHGLDRDNDGWGCE